MSLTIGIEFPDRITPEQVEEVIVELGSKQVIITEEKRELMPDHFMWVMQFVGVESDGFLVQLH